MAATPWQLGNIPGPKRAIPLKAETAAKLIQAAKKPLLVAGPLVLGMKVGNELLIDVIVKVGKNRVPVIATAHTLKGFLERKFNPAASMGVVDLTNRLTDPTWSVRGGGAHDLVVFSGVRYPLQSQMLSTLKHFAANLRTMSLDRFFQPNADWSFPNMKEEEWEKEILKLPQNLSNKRREFHGRI